jgi:hypothetical protein
MAITVTQASRRYKALITITAGTPIFVAQGLTPILADRLTITALHAGTGLIKIYDDCPVGMTPAQVAAGGDIATELAPATATAPGVNPYSDAGSIDLRMLAIDGAVSGDTVLVNAHLKI